jgi:hypothetical protein
LVADAEAVIRRQREIAGRTPDTMPAPRAVPTAQGLQPPAHDWRLLPTEAGQNANADAESANRSGSTRVGIGSSQPPLTEASGTISILPALTSAGEPAAKQPHSRYRMLAAAGLLLLTLVVGILIGKLL